MEFASARAENDELLSLLSDRLRSADAADKLVPFARAYLGLFYDIPSDTVPVERVYLVANQPLADAVLSGFDAILQRTDLPVPTQIAEAFVEDEPLGIGYVVLAGMDRWYANRPEQELLDATLAAAICFHFANVTYHIDNWPKQLLLKHPQLMAQALLDFWSVLIKHGHEHMPGLHLLVAEPGWSTLRQLVLPDLLSNWARVRHKLLRHLLLHALAECEESEMVCLIKSKLSEAHNQGLRAHLYWLTSGFLLQPEMYAAQLSVFAGRSKEKILPLLDYVVAALRGDMSRPIKLAPRYIADLIRIIAPKFAPQVDRYGNPCDNTAKVYWLLRHLESATDQAALDAVNTLLEVRVMRVYAEALHQSKQRLERKLAE